MLQDVQIIFNFETGSDDICVNTFKPLKKMRDYTTCEEQRIPLCILFIKSD